MTTGGGVIAAEGGEGTSADVPPASLTAKAGHPAKALTRQSWVTAVAITTALNTSYMAEQLSIFGMVVGVALLLTGVGLVILALAVFGREPEAATRMAPVTSQAVTG